LLATEKDLAVLVVFRMDFVLHGCTLVPANSREPRIVGIMGYLFNPH
jgi:hypothetical protein